MKITKRIKVIGKVQGVFFRKSTQEKAKELDVNGWVRNEEDGSVLTEIEGQQHAVRALEGWLKQGPPNANVENLVVQDRNEQGYTSFEIKK